MKWFYQGPYITVRGFTSCRTSLTCKIIPFLTLNNSSILEKTNSEWHISGFLLLQNLESWKWKKKMHTYPEKLMFESVSMTFFQKFTC